MAFLNFVSLLVTAFVIAYYNMFMKKTERSLSFFLCVGICLFVANLITATVGGGAYFAAIAYVIVDLLFLAIALLIEFGQAVDTYVDFVRWAKRVFIPANNPYLWLQLVSFFVFPVGIVLYFVNYKKDFEKAVAYGKAGLWGLIFCASFVWYVCGVAINPVVAPPVEG